MNEKDMNSDEINLLDLLIVIAKRKRLILSITLGAAIITAIVSLIMTPIYRAETKILPPQQTSSMASQMLSQLGALAGFAGSSLGIKDPNETYITFLKSRPVVDRIIERFGLMSRYKAKYMDDARNIVRSRLKAQPDKKSGIIIIGVEDKDPKMAAAMANAFVEELKSFSQGLAITEASQRRLFFEEQLKDVKQSLVKAEESMKGFQEKTGAVEVHDQARVVIGSIANLRAQIAAKEVQLKVMKTYATERNPDFQKVEEELRGMKEQLSRLEAKSSSYNHDPLIPTGRVPSVGTEYLRKMRDLKFNETLYELLLKQYEAAKLDEARDATVIQVVEKAIPPEKRIKPKRRLMVMIAMVTGFFISVFMAFFMEYKERASKDPENKERFEVLKKHLSMRRER